MIRKSRANILLLGGTGFIGRNLVLNLVQNNFTPFVSYRSQANLASAWSEWYESPNVSGRIYALDVSDVDLREHLRELSSQRVSIDACINLMGSSSDADVHHSNIATAVIAVETFRTIKELWPSCINYHFSSIAALKKTERSQYASFKKEGAEIIRASNVCNYVVCHSIVDSNTKKISEDLSKLAPIFCKSSTLLDRVELTSVGIDFLTDAIIGHLSLSHDSRKANKELIILEKESSLRIFMTTVLQAPCDVSGDATLESLQDELEKLDISDAVKKRAQNFLRLARIDNERERAKKNHYFGLGRLCDIRKSARLNSGYSLSSKNQELRTKGKREFIIPCEVGQVLENG